MRQVQRIAAYNVCVDDQQRLLMVRLSSITERPGSWTLPGGGVEFGEHPEDTARRELLEETGLVGHIVELLIVDSLHRPAPRDDGEFDYHSVRLVYRTNVDGADLRHETNNSTDYAAWCTRAELENLPLVEMGKLGVRLAFGSS